ncbi:MAG: PD-(D/E)XK nuclease-like domain-containing protein [Bacillota bacterium]
MRVIPAPPPGIYRNVPEADYHAWDACSQSRINLMSRSPATCQWRMRHPEKKSYQDFGTGVHCRVLQPDVFSRIYLRGPNVKSKAAKLWKDFVAAHPDNICLKPSEADLYETAYESVMAHPRARRLIEEAGDAEISVRWDEDTWLPDHYPLMMKGRADRIVGAVMVDFKTTADASADSFTRSVFSYGYHRQAALYLRGFARHGIECGEYVFICVEKEPPYLVGVYPLKSEVISLGWQESEPLIAQYARCLTTGQWPGYQSQEIGLPKWATEAA